VKVSFRFPATLASEATRAIRRRSLLLAVVGIAVLPLAWRGPSCGQDFDFHLQNWLEMARSWQEGVLYPHWSASANYLAGEPRYIFYPPLSRLLGGALGCVLPWAWTALAFTLATLLGAGFAFRAMAREWAGDDNAAVAACLYVVNPYMMFLVYERGALAELLAAVWMPLLVLYGLRRGKSLVPLALTIAALWLTNAPAGVMGCYALAAIALVAVVERRSWTLVGRAAGAVVLGLGLAGFWLLPAIYEQRWVQIDRAIGPLMRVRDSFLFGFVRTAGTPADETFELRYHNHILGMASWIVVALMLATLVAGWVAWRRKSAVWLPLAICGVAICALQLRGSEAIWRHAPEMAFLQFPWRWMLVLGVICAAMVGLAMGPNAPTRRTLARRAVAMLLLAGGMAVLSSVMFWQVCDDEDNVQAQRATLRTAGFDGTDEYTPRGADNVDADADLPQVQIRTAVSSGQTIAARVTIGRWQAEHMTATVTSPAAGFAVLRLMDYPAWSVTENGMAVQGRPRTDDGLMAVPVAAGVNQIDVRWRTTRDQWAGIWMSLAALAITLAVSWADRRKTRTAP
jgi:hypothetical protein